MADIVAWLLEQIAEDGRVAAEAMSTAPVEVRYASGTDFGPAIGRLLFARRFAPVRVLAECAAKRKILDAHRHMPAVRQDGSERHDFGCWTCHADTHCGDTVAWGWCDTVRLLASVYADRPGYDPEWLVE